MIVEWHHMDCFIKRYTIPTEEAKDIKGVDDLRWDDKVKVLALFGDSPGSTTASTTTTTTTTTTATPSKKRKQESQSQDDEESEIVESTEDTQGEKSSVDPDEDEDRKSVV